MPVITLPDGSQKTFEKPVSVYELAQSIGSGLAKATVAGYVNQAWVDARYLIEDDAVCQIVTAQDTEGLEVIRHSTAHVLAQAVKRLYPEAQVTIGPVIEEGFYYDIAYDERFAPDDLPKIETEMTAIVNEKLPIERYWWSKNDAIDYFNSIGEYYKSEIINELEEDPVSVYQQGEFIDLCRGPHIMNTNQLGAFKLTKLSGAYWRGDANNEMLQRIYGTAWANKKQLKAYLQRLEEAEKRDHRKIGKTQNLFHLQEEAPGMVFWHPKGWTVFRILEQYIRDLLDGYGYQEIRTPSILDRSLWERSGHWAKFSDDMFTTGSEDKDYAIKPMNCPCHVQIYNQGLKSYRDLPLRLAEFGSCHRNEPSGSLHGLMRVRGFTQDDAHIFCTPDQIQSEVAQCIESVYRVYNDCGFEDVQVYLSTRPEQRIGEDDVWDNAEQALEQSLVASGVDYTLQPGEGAFYGPKIEFALRDCLNRIWQCGTIQIDFSMPQRLEAEYIADDNSRHTPVMIHRAILGSLERFIAIMIEHYEGRLPLWLAPQHVIVMNITDRQYDYALTVAQKLKKNGLRVNSDLRNEKIGFKIREHTLQRIPYLIVLGDQEADNEAVAVRTLDGRDLGQMPLADFIDRLQREINEGERYYYVEPSKE